jgi:hypothetical protein
VLRVVKEGEVLEMLQLLVAGGATEGPKAKRPYYLISPREPSGWVVLNLVGSVEKSSPRAKASVRFAVTKIHIGVPTPSPSPKPEPKPKPEPQTPPPEATPSPPMT